VVDETRASLNTPLYFGHFVDGNGYKTAAVLLNPSGARMSGFFRLLNQGGFGLSARDEIGGTQAASFNYSVPPGGVYVFQSDGSPANVNVGWVMLTPDQNTTTPAGAAILSDRAGGMLVTESGIPGAVPTTHARIYVDETGGHDTGLALGNPASSATTVSMRAFQVDGVTPAGNPRSFSISPNGHMAAFAGQYITGLPSGFTGVIDITAASPIVALTLRSLNNFRGDSLLTTFPVADFNQPAPSPIVFPQIASGGGFQTQFILLSIAGSASTSLNFFDDDGTPLAVGKRQE
jgi:hypothetical protein